MLPSRKALYGALGGPFFRKGTEKARFSGFPAGRGLPAGEEKACRSEIKAKIIPGFDQAKDVRRVKARISKKYAIQTILYHLECS